MPTVHRYPDDTGRECAPVSVRVHRSIARSFVRSFVHPLRVPIRVSIPTRVYAPSPFCPKCVRAPDECVSPRRVWIKKDILYDAMLLPRRRLDYAVESLILALLLASIGIPASYGKRNSISHIRQFTRPRRDERARAAEATGRKVGAEKIRSRISPSLALGEYAKSARSLPWFSPPSPSLRDLPSCRVGYPVGPRPRHRAAQRRVPRYCLSRKCRPPSPIAMVQFPRILRANSTKMSSLVGARES